MIVGVDVSTFAVHTAWLENGSPRRWHCELGTKNDHVIDRIRSVHMIWPASVEEIVIEYPYSVSRETNAHLMAVVGAITKSAPSYCRVTWESSLRLRQAIGAKNTKKDAASALVWAAPPLMKRAADLVFWSDHEIDALVACIGWGNILTQQFGE